MNRITQRQFIFHPGIVLLVSVIAAAVFTLFVVLLFNGELRWFLLYYFMPIGIPFVAFLFDRAERYAEDSRASRIIDVVALGLALLRAVMPVPLISGHALFLSYSLLTSKSGVARVTALLILLQVAYIKIFLWQDATLIGGIVAGCLAALMYRQARNQ